MSKINYRNGDHTFVEISKEEFQEKSKGKEEIKHSERFVFAIGEASNHEHAICVANPHDLEIVKLQSGEYILTLKSEGIITHPEHSMKNDLLVAPGTYRLSQRREKDWFSLVTRRVID